MKKILICLLCSLLCVPFTAITQNLPSPEAEAFYKKAIAEINPKHVRWIKTTAAEVNEKKLSDEDVMTRAKAYGVLGNMNGQDIEAIAFLVLMQASKSAQEDLKAIMAKVKAINNAKEQQRKNLAEIQRVQAAVANKEAGEAIGGLPSGYDKELHRADSLKRLTGIKFTARRNNTLPKTKAELDRLANQIKDDLDSMSEMGEMESLRLQMAMDRMSKMMTTLSNLLKKISDTQNSIIQNLK
ncbi:MAG: hypothetical protein V9F01_00965 [Chitinophagaceae bacterium]